MEQEMNIDLNCDLGEETGKDEWLVPLISSANIACGFHAGSLEGMRTTVRLAGKFGVNIGAHPGWNDRKNFGRLEVQTSAQAAEEIVFQQVESLAQIAGQEGVVLTHVKPHGALYNQAAVNRELADSIARAVKRISVEIILVGLAGSELCEAGVRAGLSVAGEGFPDRAYNADGTLMPRRQPGAVIESPEEVAQNALKLIRNGVSFGGKAARVDTLCLHGDHPNAVENAQALHSALVKNGLKIIGLRKNSRF